MVDSLICISIFLYIEFYYNLANTIFFYNSLTLLNKLITFFNLARWVVLATFRFPFICHYRVILLFVHVALGLDLLACFRGERIVYIRFQPLYANFWIVSVFKFYVYRFFLLVLIYILFVLCCINFIFMLLFFMSVTLVLNV